MVGNFTAKNYDDKGLQWSISVQSNYPEVFDKIQA